MDSFYILPICHGMSVCIVDASRAVVQHRDTKVVSEHLHRRVRVVKADCLGLRSCCGVS